MFSFFQNASPCGRYRGIPYQELSHIWVLSPEFESFSHSHSFSLPDLSSLFPLILPIVFGGSRSSRSQVRLTLSIIITVAPDSTAGSITISVSLSLFTCLKHRPRNWFKLTNVGMILESSERFRRLPFRHFFETLCRVPG